MATASEFDMTSAANPDLRGGGVEETGLPPAVGHRQRLARACRQSGLMPFVAWLRSALRRDLRILAYHRVLESTEPRGFQFDPELISASADAFREQLAVIRRRCTPIRFDELIQCFDRGQRLPKRAVLLTFDDGYDDNYRVAYPILRDAGMSAMFFVSTGHIDSGRPYAYDWLVHMLSTTSADRLELPELGTAGKSVEAVLPPDLHGRRRIAASVLDRIKILEADVQLALISRLEQHWSIPSALGHRDCRPMSWDQLREMQRGGMEIGSHGIGHRMLAKLTQQDMREEVTESKRRLEHELGVEAIAMSYPVGGHDAFDDSVIQAVQDAGYRLACSYLTGAQAVVASDRFALKRIPIERHMDRDWFEGMLAAPEIFCHPSRSRIG